MGRPKKEQTTSVVQDEQKVAEEQVTEANYHEVAKAVMADVPQAENMLLIDIFAEQLAKPIDVVFSEDKVKFGANSEEIMEKIDEEIRSKAMEELDKAVSQVTTFGNSTPKTLTDEEVAEQLTALKAALISDEPRPEDKNEETVVVTNDSAGSRNAYKIDNDRSVGQPASHQKRKGMFIGLPTRHSRRQNLNNRNEAKLTGGAQKIDEDRPINN